MSAAHEDNANDGASDASADSGMPSLETVSSSSDGGIDSGIGTSNDSDSVPPQPAGTAAPLHTGEGLNPLPIHQPMGQSRTARARLSSSCGRDAGRGLNEYRDKPDSRNDWDVSVHRWTLTVAESYVQDRRHFTDIYWEILQGEAQRQREARWLERELGVLAWVVGERASIRAVGNAQPSHAGIASIGLGLRNVFCGTYLFL